MIILAEIKSENSNVVKESIRINLNVKNIVQRSVLMNVVLKQLISY